MKLLFWRRRRAPLLPGVIGPARIDSRTKDLTRRLHAGDVAVIDHIDLDRVTAEALVGCGVAAVVNASPSISGRYPNLGPEIIVGAGIPLVDAVGTDALARLRDGDAVRLHEETLYRGHDVIGAGVEQTPTSVALAMEEAKAGLTHQLEAFAANAVDYVRQEHDLLLDGHGVPPIQTPIEGRHVLLVVRGYRYEEDLRSLRTYIRDYRPVLVGVDDGADALLAAGHRPDLIVGDLDSISERALTCRAELVAHHHRSGAVPGLARAQAIGLNPVVFSAIGTSEDIALLLCDEASLIVTVGMPGTLVEFLDQGRGGMASLFVTRLRVGSKLVDASGVRTLGRTRVATKQVALLLLSGLVALGAAVWSTPWGRTIHYVGRWHLSRGSW